MRAVATLSRPAPDTNSLLPSTLTAPPSVIIPNLCLPALSLSAFRTPDCFKGAFRPGGQWTAENLPTIHCYSFLKGTETLAELKQRAEGHLGGAIPEDTWKVVIVRDVAPNKARATNHHCPAACVVFLRPRAWSPPHSVRADRQEHGSGRRECLFHSQEMVCITFKLPAEIAFFSGAEARRPPEWLQHWKALLDCCGGGQHRQQAGSRVCVAACPTPLPTTVRRRAATAGTTRRAGKG